MQQEWGMSPQELMELDRDLFYDGFNGVRTRRITDINQSLRHYRRLANFETWDMSPWAVIRRARSLQMVTYFVTFAARFVQRFQRRLVEGRQALSMQYERVLIANIMLKQRLPDELRWRIMPKGLGKLGRPMIVMGAPY